MLVSAAERALVTSVQPCRERHQYQNETFAAQMAFLPCPDGLHSTARDHLSLPEIVLTELLIALLGTYARADFTSVREKSCPLNRSGSPLAFARA